MAQLDFRREEFVAAVCTVAKVFAERFYDNPTTILPGFSLSAPPQAERPLISRTDAARELGNRHPTTIDRLVRAGQLKAHYPTGPSGHAKFDPDDIARLKSQRDRTPRKRKRE
jgi:hypothetical protein